MVLITVVVTDGTNSDDGDSVFCGDGDETADVIIIVTM